MALADARAICPDLSTRPANLSDEARMLEALRRAAERYGPLVARDGSDGLVVDITGVAHLFGGEAELREDLHAQLERAAFAAESAIAGTRGAAYALARHGGGIIPDGGLAAGLAPLPVSALRLEHATIEGLARVGLKRIADLLALPRAPLAKRFGPAVALRLDQALGIQAEPVNAEAATPYFGVRISLPDPIGLEGDVMAGLARLLDGLCAKLAAQNMGARRLRLELRRVDRETAVLEIGLARAMRDPSRIAALFARGVGEIDAGFGIDAMRLSAVLVEPLAPEQITTQGKVTKDDALADLISSLGNRIGFDRVLRLLPAESLIPERSFLSVPAAYAAPQTSSTNSTLRPITLFAPELVTPLSPPAAGHPPARFRWRRMEFSTLRASGPERITPEWWFDDPAWRSGLRDYWRIETKEGPRLWLYVTPQAPGGADWFMQGEFV